MINPAEFKEGELQTILDKLTHFKSEPATLHEEIQKFFIEFDEDKNGELDHKELRHFMQAFFKQYHIHLPLTDDFVDGVFREIDSNHDNKIQPAELEQYSINFVDQMLAELKKAN
jgi:Ca2+-binding EF-hand superfamily protein